MIEAIKKAYLKVRPHQRVSNWLVWGIILTVMLSVGNPPKGEDEYSKRFENKPEQIWAKGVELDLSWGNYRYMKLKAPVELELIRLGEVIDTITLAQGTVVSTKVTDNGEVEAYWMGETFIVPETIVGEIHGEEKAPATPASDEALPPVAEVVTPKGTFRNVTLAKEHALSVMVRHAEGSSFIDKTDLSEEALVGLGLKSPSKTNSAATAGAVKLKSSDLWHTSLARMTAYLNRNPVGSYAREPKGWKPLSARYLRKEQFEGWPMEEMMAFVQTKTKEHEGSTTPMEVGQEAVMASQNPDYYGPNYEKLYQVSLRPQLEKLGIKAVRQTGDNCDAYAASAVLIASLKMAGKPIPMTIHHMVEYLESKCLKGTCAFPWAMRAARGIYSGHLETRELVMDSNKEGPYTGHWLKRIFIGHREGLPLYNELILHELRSGRPVAIGMSFIKKLPMAYGHDGVIVGAKILRPQPDLVVEYEWLNSHGPEYEDKGYGKIADFAVKSAFSAKLD
jgi:hypothetical protein